LMRPNTIVVAPPDAPIPENKEFYPIYGSDGLIRFKIYLTPPE
jgi:hypothetical protein